MRTQNLATLVAMAALAGLAALFGSETTLAAAPPGAATCSILPRPTMRVRLVLESGVPADLRPPIETTVAAVWRAEGLALDWVEGTSGAEATSDTHFWLRIVDRPLRVPGAGVEPVLGVVRFFGTLPHHDVLVSWTGVLEWARRERDRQFRTLFVGANRAGTAGLSFGGFDELARRALGYAAAHEVGHFVLGLKAHDKSGLMRRDLEPAVVSDVAHRDLALPAARRRLLRARLAEGEACRTSTLTTR